MLYYITLHYIDFAVLSDGGGCSEESDNDSDGATVAQSRNGNLETCSDRRCPRTSNGGKKPVGLAAPRAAHATGPPDRRRKRKPQAKRGPANATKQQRAERNPRQPGKITNRRRSWRKARAPQPKSREGGRHGLIVRSVTFFRAFPGPSGVVGGLVGWGGVVGGPLFWDCPGAF